MLFLRMWLRWRLLRQGVRIRYRRARYWLWANTRQEKPIRRGVDWDKELRYWLDHPEELGGAYYKDGVLVRRTWAGLIRVDQAVA